MRQRAWWIQVHGTWTSWKVKGLTAISIKIAGHHSIKRDDVLTYADNACQSTCARLGSWLKTSEISSRNEFYHVLPAKIYHNLLFTSFFNIYLPGCHMLYRIIPKVHIPKDWTWLNHLCSELSATSCCQDTPAWSEEHCLSALNMAACGGLGDPWPKLCMGNSACLGP